jgi:hypothetical protein
MNTKFVKKLGPAAIRGLLIAGCAAASMGVAQAGSINTSAGGPGDGILQNFTGFDWSSDGQAYIQGFDLTSTSGANATDNFTLDYHGFASTIFATGSTPALKIPAINGGVGGTYEITLVAHLNETATCLTANCSAVSLATNSGTFAVYIDYGAGFVNPVTGTGYANAGSIEILGGTFFGGAAVFSGTPAPAGNGTGGGSLLGVVTYSNDTYLNPSYVSAGATTQTSLQLGALQTADYHPSSCFEFAGANGTTGGPCTAVGPDSATNFQLQADASTSLALATVPEPGALSLLGLGLVALGLQRSRRRSK